MANFVNLSEKIELEKNKKHNIEVVVDRIVVKDDVQARLADSLETALKLAEGRVLVDVMETRRAAVQLRILLVLYVASVSKSLLHGCSPSIVLLGLSGM